MAIQSSIYSGTALDSRTFPSTKHIATKAHMAIWRQRVSDNTWVIMNIDDYQLINNSCVLNSLLVQATYSQIEVRVADAPDELATTITDIATVAGISDEVEAVATIDTEVVSVANDITKGIGTNTVNDSAILNALTNANQTISDAASTAQDSVDTTEDLRLTGLNLQATAQDVINANDRRLESLSTASELEDVNTNTYSNGSPTATAEFSAKHYAAKSSTSASASSVSEGVSTAQAVIATSKAVEAAASALSIVPSIIKTSMSKAASEALARDNRDKFAGSGFVEWGYGSTVYPTVNEGLYTLVLDGYQDKFGLGRNYNDSTGNSKTFYPQVNVNGSILKIQSVNEVGTQLSSYIQLPPAPTVTHADASNSGLISDGKFDLNDGSWTLGTGWSISGGQLSITSAGANGLNATAILDTPMIIGVEYILEVNISVASGGGALQAGGVSLMANNSTGFLTYTFTAVTTDPPIFKANATDSFTIDDIACFPSNEISRTDLTFLESWHEDTSEKGVLYDLGNVQYKGTISTGSAGTFIGEETYSLFGNWQADSALVGNSIDIATLTTAQLEDFIGNPENNCYYDGDKLIQVRYRVRTIAGLGDEWYNVDTQAYTTSSASLTNFLRTSSAGGYIEVKGKLAAIAEDISGDSANSFSSFKNLIGDIDYSEGVFNGTSVYNTAANDTTCYNSRLSALPIALVHRRNQGAYHPVFNSNGTGIFYNIDGTTDREFWYQSGTKTIDSIAKCFDIGTTNVAGDVSPYVDGSIGAIDDAPWNGRPDSLFYDQIAEGDITDLRSSAHNKSDLEVMNDTFNRAISGDERGSEGEWITKEFTINFSTVTTAGTFGGTGMYLLGDSSALYAFIEKYKPEHRLGTTDAWWLSKTYIIGDNGKAYRVGHIDDNAFIRTSPIGSYLNSAGSGQFAVGVDYKVYCSIDATRTKSNTMTHCDIIGDPANYPQSWKDNGVIGTPLLVGENGEDYIPDGIRTTWKLSKKYSTLLLRLASSDNGVTWTASTTTIADATTNSFTKGTALPVGDMEMWFYTTHTSMAEPTVNSAVSNGTIGKLNILESNNTLYGANLVGSLINKVPASAGYASHFVNIDNYSIYPDTKKFNAGISPSHKATVPFHIVNPVAKVFPYSTIENGRKVINLVFKEMKYDTAWRDDSKFNIADNVTTTTDTNSNVILIGQKKIVTPYFSKEK